MPRLKQNREQLAIEIRDVLAGIKSVPCMDCGGAFDPVCMDFDHRPDEEKLFGISTAATRGCALSTLFTEIAKCDVGCSNCHRLRTKHRKANFK